MKSKLPERLRQVRNEKGISQRELAEILKVHYTFIDRIEGGKSSVSIDVLIAIALYFNVSTDFLLGLKDF